MQKILYIYQFKLLYIFFSENIYTTHAQMVKYYNECACVNKMKSMQRLYVE